MYKILNLIIIMLAASLTTNAQTSFLNFTETDILIDGVNTHVINTTLKGEMDQVSKSFNGFAKKQLDVKLKSKDNYLIAKEVSINQITDLRGDLIVFTFNKDNLVSLNISFKIGYDVYLNSKQYPVEFEKLMGLVEYFAYNYYNDFLPKFIKEKSKGLGILEKEHKRASKQLSKSTKKIQKSSSIIGKSEKKIEKLKEKESTVSTDAKMAKYEAKIVDADSLSVYHSELSRVNNELIEKLNPKIKTVTDDLNAAKLTLIEVRAKMKIYN